MRRRTFMLSCAALTLLPACGYRLRGMSPALKSAIALQSDTRLAAWLLSQLPRQGGIRLTADGGPIHLKLQDEQFKRHAISISPDTGRAVEYRIAYSIHAEADYGDGRTLMARRPITVHEDYLLGDSLIGDSRRIEHLEQLLLRRAAEQLYRRLHVALTL